MGITNVTVTEQFVKKDFYQNSENSAATGDNRSADSGGGAGDFGNYYTKTQTDTLLNQKSTIVGTPVDNQLAVWTGSTAIQGDANLTWDGSDLYIKNTDYSVLTLEGAGNNTKSGEIYFRTDASTRGARIYGYRGANSSDNSIGFETMDSDSDIYTPLWLNYNGNVGIEINTPIEKLSIYDSGTSAVYIQIGNSTTGIIDNTGLYVGITSTENGYIGTRHNKDMQFATNNDIKVVIDINGNVGINNLTPSYKSDTNGDGRYTGILYTDTGIMSLGDVENPNFVSGWQGTKWQVDVDGDAEFENLLIRGGLSVYELIINQLRYQDGGLIIGAGGGKIRSVDVATPGSETLTMEDPEGNGIIPFSVGSIVLMQDFDLNRTTIIKKIVRQVSAINSDGSIDFTTTTGWLVGDDTGIFEAADTLVSIGHVSDTDLDAFIYMSAVDEGNPFLRMMDGVNSYSKWSLSDESAMKLQLGNLAALAGYDIIPASPGYGLYCNNVYLSGKIVASSGAIGGWVIDADSLTDTAGLVGMSSAVTGGDDVRFFAGHTTPSSAPFSVTEAGVLKATSGTIGGWVLDSDALYTDTKDSSGYTGAGITLSDDGTIHSPAFYTEIGVNDNYLHVDVLVMDGVANLGTSLVWNGMSNEVTSTVFNAQLAVRNHNVLIWTGGTQNLTLDTAVNQPGKPFWIVNQGAGTLSILSTAAGTATIGSKVCRYFVFYSGAWYPAQ